MEALSLIFLLITITLCAVSCNIEGDSLHILRTNLNDPNYVLQSWDPTLINPCTWFHITCNNDNFVIRVQLGGNNITGVIPGEFGNFKSLVSLGLEHNQLTGSLPSSLGKLRTLRFLRVNGNQLSGIIPTQIIQLILFGNLEELNVSDNNFTGTIRNTRGKAGYAITTIVQDPRALK